MKKLIAIPLLVLYLTAISGMMVQLHFCGNRLSSWNVNDAKASCCCDTEKNAALSSGKPVWTAKNSSCCSDKVITLKIGQDQFRASDVQLQLDALQVAAIAQYTLPAHAGLPAAPTDQVYQANAPPGRWQNIPLYKLHSRLTYYG